MAKGIRGRISKELKEKMFEMAKGDSSIEEIAKKTGASVKQVIGVLEKENGIIPSEADEATDMVDFWKDKYLNAHAVLVENNLV